MKKFLMSALFIGGLTLPVNANGLNEDYSWQFKTPSERNVERMILDLRERQDGGYYEQWNVDQDFNCEDGSVCLNTGAGGVGFSTTSIGNYIDQSGDGTINADQGNSDSNVNAGTNLTNEQSVGDVIFGE